MTLICLREEIVGLCQDRIMFAFGLVRCFASFAFHWNFESRSYCPKFFQLVYGQNI